MPCAWYKSADGVVIHVNCGQAVVQGGRILSKEKA